MPSIAVAAGLRHVAAICKDPQTEVFVLHERSRWQDFWLRGAPVVILAFASPQRVSGAWTSLWFRGGMAFAMSWLGVKAFSGLAIESRGAVTCSILVAIASFVMWFSDGASLPAVVALIAVLVWAWRFAPPRRPKRVI